MPLLVESYGWHHTPSSPGESLFIFTTKFIEVYGELDILPYVVSHTIAESMCSQKLQIGETPLSKFSSGKAPPNELYQGIEYDVDSLAKELCSRAGYKSTAGIKFMKWLKANTEQKRDSGSWGVVPLFDLDIF